MAKYKVAFKEVQIWVYEYEVEADSKDKAYELAENRYFEGEQSDDNYIEDTKPIHHEVIKL